MTALEQKLAGLKVMPRAQLRSLWRDTFRRPAPDVGPDLLRRGIAHRWQERAHGKLSGRTKREIERLQKRLVSTGKIDNQHTISLKNGTRLVRSWKGKSYHVLVCGDGFEYDGRRYSSLSQIASDITGDPAP